LYIIHRDSLIDVELYVERALRTDLDKIKDLVESLEEKKTIIDSIIEATSNADSSNLAFVAKIDEDIVGAFVLAKDVNLTYYKSHFHI
jgi:predicted ATP-dependent serine protease